MNKTFLLLVFSLLSFQLFASDTLQVELGALQVVAPAQKMYSELGRVIHTINQKEIQTLPVRNIDELLETITGIDIRNRGVGNTQADISIRGGSFDQVLILLNGVNITDPQTGHHNLNIPVDLADVERIELLQGSSARLLGPNAFSGAINIVTASKQGRKVNARLTAGSFDTYSQGVSASVGTSKYSIFASASRNTSEGYIDNTDYEVKNAFAHAAYRTKKAGEFGLQLASQMKDFGANSFYTKKFPNQFEHTQTQLAAFDWKLNVNNLKVTAQAYNRQHYDRFELFRTNPASWYKGHNYHLTNTSGAKALAAYNTDFGKFSLTAEQRREHIISTVLGNDLATVIPNKIDTGINFTKSKTRDISNVAFDYSLFLAKFYVSAGAAISRSNDFGLQPTWGVDLGYQIDDYTRLFTAINTAVRLPTFTDLYYSSIGTHRANPNLKPEKSSSIELGTKYQNNRFKADATVFYKMGTNIIDWVVLPGDSLTQSQNLTKLNTSGFELSVSYRADAQFIKNVGLSYAFVNQDKVAVGFDSRYALDYLRHKVTLGMQHSIYNNISANWFASYNDRNGTYTDFATSMLVEYKPYFMLNLRIKAPAKYYTVFADINNIFNANFADFGGLTQPGIHFNAGIRFHL